MASLLHRFGRGRVVATTVVIVTAGLLLAVTRMVFSHPAESAKEPGIVLTATPRVTSSQSSVTATQSSTAGGGAGSTRHEPSGSEADSSTSSDSSTQGLRRWSPTRLSPSTTAIASRPLPNRLPRPGPPHRPPPDAPRWTMMTTTRSRPGTV